VTDEFTIDFPDGPLSGLPLTPLGNGRYRVEDLLGSADPNFADPQVPSIHYQDIIETETTEHPRRVRFIRVVERSQETLVFGIDRHFWESAELRGLLDWVLAQGGRGCLDAGALLWVSFPFQAKEHFLSEFDRIVEAYNRSLPESAAGRREELPDG
jgi:hypothetical protein